jgi:antirestriction protein ArdC
MLIAMQRPDATQVAGYGTWHSLGRQVRKGEHGIKILAPMVCGAEKLTVTNVATGEKTEMESASHLRFRVVNVFDVEQTFGEDLPDATTPRLLAGEAPDGLWAALAAQVGQAGCTVVRTDCSPANGSYSPETRTVTVRPDLSDAQACKTLAHELAHVLMEHDYATRLRSLCEVEAESVAYVVMRSQGVETDGYSLPYVATWAGDTKAVAATAAAVVKVAHQIMTALEQHHLASLVPA